MSTSPDPEPSDDALVEQLLRDRYQAQEPGDEHPELELVALWLDGQATPAQAARVAEMLAGDPELAEAVDALRQGEGEETVVPIAAARRRRSAPGARIGAIAAAVIAAVGVAVYLLSPRVGDQGDLTPVQGARIGAGPTTAADVLTLQRRARDDDSEMAPPHDAAEIVYSARRPGYIAAVELSAEDQVVPVYPQSGRAAALPAATGATLPVEVDLGAGDACRWLVVAIADHPFVVTELADAVRTAPRAPGRCAPPTREGAFPRARTVQRLRVGP